jgi:(1->4)-alpha-D-glucan 1-alpha-D-glucosylmutase
MAVVPRLVAGLTASKPIDPIGPTIWGETGLHLPDARPGTRYRDGFTGETIVVKGGEAGGVLPLAEVFRALPFALLQRVG